MSPRLATFFIFVVHGAVVGTWIAAIPGAKTALGATGTAFGLALVATWVGALVAQQVAPGRRRARLYGFDIAADSTNAGHSQAKVTAVGGGNLVTGCFRFAVRAPEDRPGTVRGLLDDRIGAPGAGFCAALDGNGHSGVRDELVQAALDESRAE